MAAGRGHGASMSECAALPLLVGVKWKCIDAPPLPSYLKFPSTIISHLLLCVHEAGSPGKLERVQHQLLGPRQQSDLLPPLPLLLPQYEAYHRQHGAEAASDLQSRAARLVVLQEVPRRLANGLEIFFCAFRTGSAGASRLLGSSRSGPNPAITRRVLVSGCTKWKVLG